MSDKSVPYTRFENGKDDAVPSSSSYIEEIYTPGAAAVQDQDDDHPYKSDKAVHIRGLIDDYKKIHGHEPTGNASEIATKLNGLFSDESIHRFQEIEEAVGQYYIPYRDRNRLQSQASTTAVLAGQGAAVMRLPEPERRSFLRLPVMVNMLQQMNPNPWIRPNLSLPPLNLDELTKSSAMRTKLLGRNNLARKLMVNLALNERERHPDSVSITPVSMTQKQRQMTDLIQRRVDATKGREVVSRPRLSLSELNAYGSSNDPFYAEVQNMPPFTEASCLTTKKQLQQQRDELIEILKEKHVMLLNLQTIYLSSTDKKNQDQAASYSDATFQYWLARTEEISRKDIITLREQIKELRERIDQLTAKIKPSCTMLGGSKTKSKYTKSKKTKRRNRKYSKRN